MKYLRNVFAKWKNGKLAAKLKGIKNIEIMIAVILALLAAVCFFAATAKKKAASTSANGVQTTVSAEMDERELRLAALISEIYGVGRSRVMISSGEGTEVIGVVVVAEGAKEVDTRVRILRCVEKATGATVDKIEIFEMGNGG